MYPKQKTKNQKKKVSLNEGNSSNTIHDMLSQLLFCLMLSKFRRMSLYVSFICTRLCRLK